MAIFSQIGSNIGHELKENFIIELKIKINNLQNLITDNINNLQNINIDNNYANNENLNIGGYEEEKLLN